MRWRMSADNGLLKGSLIALLVAFALTAAACSGGTTSTSNVPQPGGTGTSTTGSSAGSTPTTTSGESAGSDLSGTTTTLAADLVALGAGCTTQLNADAQDRSRGEEEFGLKETTIIARVDAVENLVACCMSNAGFEYFPVDYPTARKAMDSNSKPSGLSGDEFRAQFGYGITTLYAGPDAQATMGAGEQNNRIRASLSPGDRVAYERTLYGENPEATFIVGLDEENFEATGGCTRFAIAQVFYPDELGTSFVNYQNSAAVNIDQDPRIIAAYQDWATCMRDAGYAYANSNEVDADLATRLDAITGGADPSTLAADAQAALTQLQGEELAIAAADRKCELEFVDAIKTQVETELLGPDANK